MLFASLEFLVFFVLVFCAYWFLLAKSRRAQNVLLLAASYVFYGWWDRRFLLLLLTSSAIDYAIGIALGRSEDPATRKRLLGLSLAANLSLLFIFKYFGFFAESLAAAVAPLGVRLDVPSLQLVLPVGISFYTLQTLSYTIDVYRRTIPPTRDVVAFLTFVAFFPQLVAGPIERAGKLIPQLERPRAFSASAAQDGLRLILWGLFLKVVIADSLGVHAGQIFDRCATTSGSTLLVGCAYFAVQVYGDFAGYSYVAVGLGKLMGFELTLNFRYPFLQSSIAGLWRSWHVTMLSWFTDYVYRPMARLRGPRWKRLLPVLLVFVLSGLWHGAAWSFALFGLVHGIYVSLSLLRRRRRIAEDDSWIGQVAGATFAFFLFVMTAPLFRGEPLAWTLDCYSSMLSPTLLSRPAHAAAAAWIVLLLAWEWRMRDRTHPLSFTRARPPVRWAIYCLLGILILRGLHGTRPHVYFQF